MVLEFIHGLMAEFIKDNIKMIKNMDMVSTAGQMAEFTVGSGPKESNMELEFIQSKVLKLSMEYGKMVKESSGLMHHKLKE